MPAPVALQTLQLGPSSNLDAAGPTTPTLLTSLLLLPLQKAEMDHSREVDMAEVDDPRVDLCLFCLPPHRLRPVDVRYMAELGKVVPILPIVTKADTMSTAEAAKYRREVYNRLQSPGVPGSRGEGSGSSPSSPSWRFMLPTHESTHLTGLQSKSADWLGLSHFCLLLHWLCLQCICATWQRLARCCRTLGCKV